MAAPAEEQVQDGPGEFRDVVDVQLLDDSLLLAARMARAPSRGSTGAMALVLADGRRLVELAEDGAAVESWERARVGPLELATEEPLQRWSTSLDAPGARIELELRAVTAPADLAEPATASVARAAGVRRYSQLCHARGTAEISGRRRDVDAIAVRTHRWGPLGEAGRTRFLTAASAEGTLLTLAATRAESGTPHGEELVGGQTMAAAGDETLPFETVRLSSVFGPDGLPVSAGAELFRPGDELPSRLAGVAAAGIAADDDGARTSLTLFRFSIDGVPALGSYEIESRA
jgi:hypothetical protein